ncbi:Hypothetical protein Ccan_22530 [Capnocytophaga canimorsus Cc5]|uniref:RagB/SusD family nutrient uptake outer membrane protein n=1 Tax=Capnocytophaga canimorsus (strain 5) TaxID=860228 RepID=F9YV59_CAPCC|nr:RagB/SusD family nutrient uptake outer membrane protein [Capnocytophaga canimorsus]AEK24368.1 Hypothetical protein Ccan_22530 [Capnocytophaga canimorsus Cc5]
MKKNIINIIKTTLLGILLAGCNPDFLDQEKLGEETSNVFFNSQQKALNSLTAAYSDIKDYRFGWTHWAFGETLSDNAIYGGSDGDNSSFSTLKDFNANTSHPLVTNKWRLCYRGINKANQTIEGVQKMNSSLFESEALKNRIIAEAKVLRAFYHFELVRCYGRVPILDRLITSNSDKIAQSDIETVYKFIVADLEAAQAHLPKKSQYDVKNRGRITQGFAQGLLAKVNLYNKNYPEAKKWAKAVMDSNEYQLVANFADIFTFEGEHGAESIFEVSFFDSQTESAAAKNNGNFQTLFMLPRNITYGYGINLPTQELANAFDAAGDVIRKKATLLTTEEVYQLEISPEILNSGDLEKIEKEKAKLEFNRTGLFQKKMYVAPNKRSKQIRNNANNIRMMRYAEILLIYAEAAAQTADEVAAKMALNQVRLRAGLSEVISTGDALKEAIFNERRLELAGESERYHDLIRTGRANATILPGWSEAKKYWPVPQTEIDNTTGEIEQNSGYNN